MAYTSNPPTLSDMLKDKPLLVFALENEAAEAFAGHDLLFTGIGKINAVYALMKALAVNRPSIIINLGSAGSNTHKRGEVICCTRFVQRDMDATALGFEKYQTPFSQDEAVLHYGLRLPGLPEGTCGSGDSFETNHFTDDYDVIDMEAYALARVALREQIPFLCLKYISDGADGTASTDWSTAVHSAAEALKAALRF